MLVVGAGMLGLLIGSFLNVVVWRVPRGESVVRPRSACPRCGHRIRAWDNVPVLSWLVLRGRCRDCRAPISARYPLVEAGTAVVFAVLAWSTGWSWALPAVLYLGASAVALALIDLDVRRLPDALVLPAYPVLGVLLLLASWSPGGASDWGALLRAAAGGVVLLLGYTAIVLVRPGGMGLGDVKLSGVLGMALAWWGWGAFVVGAFAGFVLGGAYAAVLMVAGRARRGTGIPFGPWMLLGALLGVTVGERLWSSYLGLLG